MNLIATILEYHRFGVRVGVHYIIICRDELVSKGMDSPCILPIWIVHRKPAVSVDLIF